MEWWNVLLGIGIGLGGVAVWVAISISRSGRRARRAEFARRISIGKEAGTLSARFAAVDQQALPTSACLLELAESNAIWTLVPGRSAYAIDAASRALATGIDSPSLRELAGLSRLTPDDGESKSLLESALRELDLNSVDPNSDDALLLALRFYCLEWRAFRLPATELAAWSHEAIGHEGPLLAQEIVELDEESATSVNYEVAPIVDRFLLNVKNLQAIYP